MHARLPIRTACVRASAADTGEHDAAGLVVRTWYASAVRILREMERACDVVCTTGDLLRHCKQSSCMYGIGAYPVEVRCTFNRAGKGTYMLTNVGLCARRCWTDEGQAKAQILSTAGAVLEQDPSKSTEDVHTIRPGPLKGLAKR